MKLFSSEIIDWLIEGDNSIKYQVYRDLLDINKPELQENIQKDSWAWQILQNKQSSGHWGLSYYQPKWISTHYTLLLLKNLAINPELTEVADTLKLIIAKEIGSDGGINPSTGTKFSDVCINGMFLNFAAYFRINEVDIVSIIDFIISQQMVDGGFNCQKNRSGANHSSFHSTISVTEGINEYLKNGYSYRKDELKQILDESIEFMLQHRLFKSDKTGLVINKQFTIFSYPCYWKYDVLRGLDLFQNLKLTYDSRLDDAFELLLSKRKPNGKWNLGSKHPGKTHLEMEKPGTPSRWNTLRALRVFKHFEIEI